MAEVFEPETPEAEAGIGDAGGTATGLALDRVRARRGGKRDDAADRFLAAQEALVAKQVHHLDEQFRHLRLRHFSERLKVTLQLLTILVGAAVVVIIGLVAWQASRADGIVVDAFSVPPAYAAKGLTGAVVAGKVLDRLVKFDHDANPLVRTAVDGAWTENAKIELPDTGLTIDEVERLLRKWLGHEKHVTGELVETPSGVALTARTEAGEDVEVSGDPAQLAALTDRLAEQLYARAQPLTYAWRMMQLGRNDESDAITSRVLAETDSAFERARAHHIRGNVAQNRGDLERARAEFTAALASPVALRRALSRVNLARIEDYLGHAERAQDLRREAQREYAQAPNLPQNQLALQKALSETDLLIQRGDCAAALVDAHSVAGRRVAGSRNTDSAPALPLACLHDIEAAKRLVAPGGGVGRISLYAEDWPALVAFMQGPTAPRHIKIAVANEVIALAALGRLDEAVALAAPLPADCYACQIARAQLAEAKGDRAGADRLFASAVALGPQIPMAQREWGRVALARGDARGALAHAEAAIRISPRYHEALELAGEAKYALGDASGASERFAQAAALAPRWGRLRLKWGEALARQGKVASAHIQLESAARLDLTPAERSELAAQGRQPS